MRIRKFSANNYKSILQLDTFDLTDGFNIITGQNASGKTALLELLSLRFTDKPHRSVKTVPNKGDITDSLSIARVELQMENSELKRILRNTKQIVAVPFPDPKSPLSVEINAIDYTGPSIDHFLKWFTLQPSYSFDLKFSGGNIVRPAIGPHSFIQYPITPNSQQMFYYPTFSINLSNGFDSRGGQWQDNRPDLGVNIAPQLQQLVYRFSSERRIQARYAHGTRSQLLSSAENLAEVLNVLQPDANSFAEFNRQVSEILPQVRWVSVKPVDGGNEIAIWNVNANREDLAVSLDETGSGIGQVLAILYVAFTSQEPSTIIIDEPQSFLHPSSAVKLIQVLKRYPQHQFILATHSASIISAAGPSNLLALTYDGETHLEVFDLQKATSFQNFLDKSGLEIRDTFGADSILWVEGPTEQKTFPVIIEKLCKVPLMGTSIVPVSATGDLEGEDAKRVFAMYRTLARGNPLLPPALTFILDQEVRTPQQIKELVMQGGDRVMFLPRRMFENYLLRPAAIAHVMNSIEGFRDIPVTEIEVQKKIEEKAQDNKFFSPIDAQPDWINKINAGKLLSSLFSEISEQRVEYRKTEHSVKLSKWLLENHSEDLTEVANVLAAALKKKV